MSTLQSTPRLQSSELIHKAASEDTDFYNVSIIFGPRVALCHSILCVCL